MTQAHINTNTHVVYRLKHKVHKQPKQRDPKILLGWLFLALNRKSVRCVFDSISTLNQQIVEAAEKRPSSVTDLIKARNFSAWESEGNIFAFRAQFNENEARRNVVEQLHRALRARSGMNRKLRADFSGDLLLTIECLSNKYLMMSRHNNL